MRSVSVISAIAVCCGGVDSVAPIVVLVLHLVRPGGVFLDYWLFFVSPGLVHIFPCSFCDLLL